MKRDIDEQIAFLQSFQADILEHFRGQEDTALRTRINRGIPRARDILTKAGALKSVTLSPPPAIGGLVISNADPLEFILQSYYGRSMTPAVSDMIEQAIGVLENPEYQRQAAIDTSKAVTGRAAADAVALPETVTLSWMVRHVPVKFWIWLAGIVTAAFGLGVKLAPFLSSS